MAQTIQRGLTREPDFQSLLSRIPSDIDLKWGVGLSSEEVREAPVLETIFSFIEEVAGYVTSFTTAISSIVEVLSSVVDVLSAVIGIGVDVLEGFFLAIKTLLEQLRQLVDGTSVSGLVHAPLEPRAKRKPSEVLYDVGMSYLDQGDILRPIAPTRTTYGAALVAMYSAPDLDQLAALFNKVKEGLIGGSNSVRSALSDVTKTTKSSLNYKDDAFKLNGTTGLAPDWAFNKSLANFAFISGLLADLDQIIRGMTTKRQYAEKVNAAINGVRSRIANIERLIARITSAINSLVALLALGDSNGIFLVQGNGSSEDFARAIINAPNHPDYPKAKLNERSYNNFGAVNRALGESAMFSGAFVLHLQAGASPQSIDLVKNLINAIFAPTGKTVINTEDKANYGNTQEVELARDAAGNLKSKYKDFDKARSTLNQGLRG